ASGRCPIDNIFAGMTGREKISDGIRSRTHSTSDLAFLANVHSAKELAKRESIPAIFACKL
ncbi:MAG: hypothetical protein WB685_10435, partial [Pseudolabrys sp.]